MTVTSAPSLSSFLLDRLAEREALARAATSGPWMAEPLDGDVWGPGNRERVLRASAYAYDRDVEFIAANDPATVLAECAALRAVVELHGRMDPCDAHDGFTFETVPCDTLRALAAAWSSHPAYEAAWAA